MTNFSVFASSAEWVSFIKFHKQDEQLTKIIYSYIHTTWGCSMWPLFHIVYGLSSTLYIKTHLCSGLTNIGIMQPDIVEYSSTPLWHDLLQHDIIISWQGQRYNMKQKINSWRTLLTLPSWAGYAVFLSILEKSYHFTRRFRYNTKQFVKVLAN